MSRSRWLEIGSPEWGDALSQLRHDVYHLPDYVAMEAQRLGGMPRLFLYQDSDLQFLCPLIVRHVPGLGAKDAISPYGYPGPIASAGADSAWLLEAAAALKEELARRQLASAFVRLHPLLSPAGDRLASGGTLLEHGRTVSIDLRSSAAEVWDSMRSGHRSEIKRGRRRGFGFSCDPEWGDLEEFLVIYEETMTAVGAEPQYFFDRAYFHSLRDLVDAGTYLATVRLDEEPAAAAIFTEVGGLLQYHLSGASRKFRKQQPTKLLLDQVRRWAAEQGFHTLHLGGGLGGREDSLYKFKAGFSQRRHVFQTWRIVPDPGAYEALCAAMGVVDGNEYFPAYRKPGQRSTSRSST